MRVVTKGIGAHDIDLELRALNLLVGPNGSGKSKLAESIRMAALGYVPHLGKRPVDLAALMQGDSMSVELSLDGGRTIRRTLDRKENGYTATAEASWMRQGKPGEISKAITKLFGDEELDVAECLDIRELLAASPNQRAARMEQLLAAGARKSEEIASDVARLIVMRLADTTEDRMPKDYRDAIPMVPEKQRDVLFEQAQMIQSKIGEAGIAGAVTWANAEKRGASEGLKHKEAAAHELRKRAAQVPEPDERDIIRLEGEKTKLLQELGAVRQRWSEYQERSVRTKGLADQLEALEEASERTNQVALDAEAVHGKAAAELREKSDKILEQMGSIKMPPEEDYSAVQTLEDEAKGLVEKASAIYLPNVSVADREERALQEAQEKLEEAKGSPWSEVIDIAQDIEDKGTTKGIKTALAPSLKRLRELAKAQMGQDSEGLKHEVERLQKAFEEATEASDKARKRWEKAKGEQLSLAAQADAKMTKARELRKEINERRRVSLADFDAKRASLAAERSKFEKALETHKKALEGARSEKAAFDRRLASVNDQIRGAGELPAEPSKPDTIEQKLKASQAELANLIAARATHTEIQTVLGEIEEAKAKAVVFTAIEWALQRQREIEISNAGGPLMRFMAQFLKAAGRKETPFVRASQGLCAIGWKTPDGREIQIQALSGGEWCLFAAALTSSVILCRRSVLKVLLVEAGETDAYVLAQLLAGIKGVNQEQVMTAIVMSPRPPASVDPAWSMVRIFEENGVAAHAAA